MNPPITDGAAIEKRARAIEEQLRCPVCQALSVADSDSDAARAMRGRIHELVAQGYSDAQIIDYFVDRYGEWIRLSPSATGSHWIVWAAPIMAVLLGAAVVAGRVRGGPGANSSSAEEDDVLDPYRAQVLVELAELQDAGGGNGNEGSR